MATHGSGGKEQEDEVIPAIRHDDAEWKLIQKNTFTRWVNNHLSKVGESINALDTDFADGLKLIALAAVLSQKNLGKYNKKVSFRSQKLENVSLALNFFQNVEHIKIVNIDSSHIVDHNKKLIMGLIWTLILHYSISMGWTQHNEDGTQSDDTPKTKLLNWIRSRLPGVPITNFTTDWNDGLAIGALVNAIFPDSVPDWQSWTPDKALENTQKAMDEAQDKLGIAPLITPAELIHPDIDERSVMTYLSQFPAAKPAPAKPTKAHAYMSRVDEKPLRGQSTEFEVHLTTDGYKPKITIRDSEGNDVHHTVIKKSSTMFTAKYSPMRVGEHKLHLALTDLGTGTTEAVEGGEKIVRVQPAARLRDLPHKVFVKDLVKLEVEDAGDEGVEIVVVDSARTNHALPVLASSDGSLHTAEYIPEHAGLHTVNVFQRKAHIPGSPVRMPVSKKGGYVLYGRGLESDGVRVGDRVEVIVEPESVDSLSVNEGQIALAVRKPDGSFLPVDAVFDSDKDRLTFEYEPTEVGEYTIEATSNGEPIGASPYKVTVSPATPSKVRAFGAGLKSGIVNHPSVFSVETNGQADGLAVSIEGPSKAEISSQDRGNGAALFSYTPMAAGIYKVNLLSRGEHIKDSPFVAQVVDAEEGFHPSAGRVSGPTKPIYTVGEPVPFKIDNRLVGGKKKPSVTVLDANLNNVPVKMSESGPGTYNCEFTPTQPGKYNVDIALAGVALPGTPLSIPVRHPVDLSKLKIFGPGIEGPVISRVPTQFTIDAKEAGGSRDVKDVQVLMADRQGNSVDIDVLDNNDGSFTVKYTAPNAGAYQVNVVFAGEKISPIEINVKPQIDISGIKVEGLENAIVTVNCEKELHVFTSDGANTRILITSPSGRAVEAIIESTIDGFHVRFTPSEVGDYTINVSYADLPIESSPFMLHSLPDYGPGNLAEAEYVVSGSGPPRADLVSVRGPGLGPVIAQRSTHVIIDTTNAGFGDIDLFVDGPTRTPLHCVDNQDGTLTMYYVPRTAGLYYLRVMFDNQQVAGSPFQVMAVSQLLASPIISSENEKNSLSSAKALVGTRVTPRIDIGDLAKKGAKPRLLIDKDGHISEAKLNQLSPSVFATQLPLGKPGNYKFMASIDDVPIAEKTVIVQKGQDALKCRAEGKGLTEATVGKKAIFSIDSNGAGDGNVYVEIQGPSEPETFLKQREDGSCEVEFVPKKPGDYNIGILYGDEKKPIRGSPFLCHVDYPLDASQVKVKGLEKKDVQSGEPVEFEIDVTGTKDAPVTASVPPIYQQPLVEKSQSNPRIYKAKFTPVGEVGEQIPITVNYDGKPLSASPFLVKLQPKPHPDNVQIVQSPIPSGQEQEDKAGTILASREAIVILDLKNCGDVKSCEAVIIGPDGQRRDCIVARGQKANEIEIRWKTDVAGIYKADVYFDGIKVNKSVEVEALPTASSQDVIREYDAVSTAGSEMSVGSEQLFAYTHDDSDKAKLTVRADRPDAVQIALESKPHEKDRHKKTEIIHVKPTAEGANTIHVYYGGTEVDNFTYQAHRQSPSTPASSIRDHIDSVVDHQESAYYRQQSSRRSSSTSQPSVRLPAAASVSPAKSLTHHSSSTSIESSATDHLYTREFKLNLESGLHSRDLQAEVSMPSSQTKKDTAEIVDNHDGSVSVRYTPKTTGAHELNILHKGAPLQGTPIKFYVDSYADGFATVYGPGLQSAIVGEPAQFTVCARKSNAKELSVSIEGPAKSNIKIHDNKDGTCSVAWVPPVPGEYKAHVSLGGKEVKDSPFTVLVMGEGQKRSHLSVGSTSEVALNINQQELKGISASIKSPSGIEEPCHVRMIDGGRLGVSFTPRESGEHLITVKRDGKLLPKAPFKIKVDKSQVGDASKVEVSGAGKAKAVCCEENELLVDTTKAGYGGLSVSVQGPSKAELRCKEVKAGLIKVLYKPTEPGVYAISVKFADHHVSNSPFTVNCTGKGLGRVQQQFNRKAEQASMVLANQESLVYMKLPGTSPMDTNAKIKDPKGKTEDVEMRDLGQQFYQIKFKPKMEGVHTLSILHKDAHIVGSPFQFTVGVFSDGGAHKVRATGVGIARGETNTVNSFNIYTREAGAGQLSMAIEGPSKAAVEFHDHKDGNCHVDYKVTQPGEYLFAIKFNDVHIADSPFKVFIAPATGEARKLELASFHDQGVPAGKAFTFTVLTHRAKGHLEAKVVTTNNEVETIDIVPIEEGESYALRFVPKCAGNHYIHVTLDGAPMRDSPFRIRVGGVDSCDPTAISASGDGLKKAQTGQKCEFIVNTMNAGAGVLTCQMDGPSKATLDAYELEKGYKVRYTALAPGDYFCAIKYNAIHIPGSPFRIPVEGQVLGGNGYNETSMVRLDAAAKTSKGTVVQAPTYTGDASKVEVKGAGLNKFFPGRIASFTIDTQMAGTNLLFVGVVTTKGPVEEVTVRHQGNGHYVVSYKIPDRLKGFIFINYGEKPIPGSPFAIEP